MAQDIPWQLLEMYFANEKDALENQKVKEWIDSAAENAMILEQLQNYYQTYGSLPIEFVPDTKVALKRVSGKIPAKSRVLQLSTLWWKVAAVLLIGFFGWWLVQDQVKIRTPELASLLKVDSISTDIVLSDGSHIWLNTHTSIKYPDKFGDTRDVYLEGEAYFEIAHDSQHPFVVHTGNIQTRVLGTKFDIRSYSSEKQVEVTVTEGRVGFGSLENTQVILTPNQKGLFNKLNQEVIKIENDNQNFLAWKTFEFHFDNQPLEVVFQTLAEVYHFSYRFNNPSLENRVLNASFKHRPVEEIIETISLSTEVKILLQNGIYTIE